MSLSKRSTFVLDSKWNVYRIARYRVTERRIWYRKLSDTKAIWYKSYLVQKLSGTKAIWYKSYLVQKLSGTKAIWYKSYLVQKLSGTKAIWYNSYLVQKLSGKAIWYKSYLVQKLSGTKAIRYRAAEASVSCGSPSHQTVAPKHSDTKLTQLAILPRSDKSVSIDSWTGCANPMQP